MNHLETTPCVVPGVSEGHCGLSVSKVLVTEVSLPVGVLGTGVYDSLTFSLH